jgi:hypothetical protein
MIFISGCVSVNIGEKVYTTGKIDLEMTVDSEYPNMVSQARDQIDESIANLTDEELKNVAFEYFENGFTFTRHNFFYPTSNLRDEGNWLIHRYVLIQTAQINDFVEDSSNFNTSLVDGEILIDMPGEIESYGLCQEYQDGRARCSLFNDIHLESTCWLFFCW